MILKVQSNTTVDDLQDKFNECFPEFWIEFYDGQSALKRNHPCDGFSKISDISSNHKLGELKIYTRSKTEKIVDDFKWQFGLLVKLFHIRNNGHTLMQPNESLTPAALPALPYNEAAASEAG